MIESASVKVNKLLEKNKEDIQKEIEDYCKVIYYELMKPNIVQQIDEGMNGVKILTENERLMELLIVYCQGMCESKLFTN